ncbi:amino acid adenylation domain-containing protein [Paenibacillus sp. M1]|uniref:Amino acid adenylation domain-containing protein n=1 Tax=Paenibacillus haidiansis TaxID=1574488 RepID=A0ABU7VQR4_9BACL
MEINRELEQRRSKLSAKQLRLLEQWKQKEAAPTYTIPPGGGKYNGTVSPAQRRLWFMDQLLTDKSAYNMYAAVRLKGPLRPDKAEAAFRAVYSRHENLHANFVERDGRPVVVMDLHEPAAMARHDFSTLDPEASLEAVESLLQAFISYPFDLAAEPLFHAMLVRLSGEEHILAVCMHHIVSDGWSMGVLLKTWMQAYQTLMTGAEPDFPELPVSYADYANWQIANLETGKWDGHLAYWKSRIEGAGTAALAPDNRYPDEEGHSGGEVRFSLPDELCGKLAAFSAASGITMFAALFSLFNILLYRYTRETKIVIGTPIANRNYTEIEELVGYFANLLPLRTDIDPNSSFRELAGQVMRSAMEDYTHQDYPFDRLIEVLQPRRTQQLIPLVRNLFTYQNYAIPPLSLAGVEAEYLPLYNFTSKSDLLLSMVTRDGRIEARLEYDRRLFHHATMQRFARNFVRLAGSAMEQPDLPVNRLEVLEEEEVRQKTTRSSVTLDGGLYVLHRKFAEVAGRFAERTALQYGSERWTYRELDQYANRIAHYISEQGAGPGQFVGLFVDRSPLVVAGILGILKAGCAYIPVDPAYPLERIAFMLKDAGCRFVLTDNETSSRLSEAECRIVNMAAEERAITEMPATAPEHAAEVADVAYMIYTSGSTGTPKGVLIEHGNVSRLFASTQDLFHFNEHDVWSLFHSYAFDFSVWEIWGALLYGGKLVIVPSDVTRSFEQFYKLLVREGVTVLNQTPSAFKQLMHTEEMLCSEPQGQMLNELRYVIFGGEALEPASLRPWVARHGDDRPRLINMYGITEITVHATYRRILLEDLDSGCGNIIGGPLPDMHAYVLDENLQLLPAGAVGELYIAGPGLSRGYWNREDLNRSKFVADPFISGDPHGGKLCEGRMYRSGDLARWTHAGELEYMGRIDDQVKVRGFRIELGEIEAALQQNEFVSQNVATVEFNDFGDPKIVSYYIPHERGMMELSRELQREERAANRWESVFDGVYQAANPYEDKSFHIAGWNDSYTGGTIGEEEMKEWTQETVSRIRRYRPRRIFEIGCGTGLLLFRLAPGCESYTAVDFSEQAIDYVQNHLSLLGPDAGKVRLFKANAHDIAGIDVQEADMVIINSVAQYFPDDQYLNRVLELAAAKLRKGGCIFLGDVCGLMFAEVREASIARTKADSSMSVADFNRFVSYRITRHNELLLDIDYFHGLGAFLPDLRHVELLYKRGKFHHEMNKFRFDAVLHTGPEPVWDIAAEYDWQQMSAQGVQIGSLRSKHEQQCFVIRNIPNARIEAEWDFVKWCRQANPQASISSYPGAGQTQKAPDPQVALMAWGGDSHRLEFAVTRSAAAGCLDAVLYPAAGEKLVPGFELSSLPAKERPGVSDPLRAKLEAAMGQRIKAFLKGLLPEYMIPAEFVALESFPLTVNGKIDRGRLRLHKPFLLKEADPLSGNGRARTPAEEAIRDLWLELLDIGDVGPEESFFEVGGHSLLAAQMMFRIRKTFQVNIPLLQLMQEPTIRGIAAAVERTLADRSAVDLDLPAEAVLDDDISAAHLPAASRNEQPAVLLTGATGFFGAFLLSELLVKGHPLVYCLIRAVNADEGYRRIVDSLRQYGLWNEAWQRRIVAVTGDLALPGLGLEPAVYNELGDVVSAIYHNGAAVNFAQPYASLAAANVSGSKEVLKLAVTKSLKTVHFISTLYVFTPEDIKRKKIILENDVPAHHECLQLGYTQTKWVAEQLMRQARLRGIPVKVFRLGRIAGDSQTGACQENDFFWRAIRLCLRLGLFPDIDFPFNLIPADRAAQAVVALAEQEEAHDPAYHLLGANHCTFYQILKIFRERGYPFECLPWEQWKARVEERLVQSGDDEDISLLPFIGEMAGATEAPQFDAAYTNSVLSRLSLPAAKVTEDLLGLYVDYFVDRGFFKPLIISD